MCLLVLWNPTFVPSVILYLCFLLASVALQAVCTASTTLSSNWLSTPKHKKCNCFYRYYTVPLLTRWYLEDVQPAMASVSWTTRPELEEGYRTSSSTGAIVLKTFARSPFTGKANVPIMGSNTMYSITRIAYVLSANSNYQPVWGNDIFLHWNKNKYMY